MRLEVLALLGLTFGSCHGQGLRGVRKRLQPSGGAYPSISVGWNTSTSSSLAPISPDTSESYSDAPTSVESGTTSGYSSSRSLNGTALPSEYSPTTTGQSSPYTSVGTENSTSHSLTGNGTIPSTPTNSAPSNSSNLVCSGKTLNVLEASLDWWFTRTLYNVVSTISIQFNSEHSQTGWTVLPATTPFDVASALASPTCSSYLTYNTDYNSSLWDVICTPAPTPVAAATTIISQTAYEDVGVSTGTGPIPDVVETPPPASISIPSSGGTYLEGTAFVYFSAYEIVTKGQGNPANGSVGCAKTTNTYTMEAPFSFEYNDGDVNGTELVGEGVVGDVNPAFLDVVGVEDAVAGSWVAAPTVVLIVQDIFAAEAVLAASAENGPLLTTHTSLLTPEPTLPSGFTPAPGGGTTGKFEPTIGFTGRVESTAPSLAIPTSPGPGRPPGGRPTNVQPPPIAQPTGDETGRPTNGGGPTEVNGGRPTTGRGGGVGQIVSAIISAVKPTNAVQVLQQAELTFENNNPTVAAIVPGVSGPNPSPAGDAPGGSAPNGGSTPNQNDAVSSGPNGTPIIVVGGTTFTADSETQFDLGPSAILTPGGRVVVSGTTVSLASGLTAVVVNGNTYGASGPLITPAPVLTIGGTTYAPNGGSTYNIAGQSLTPGGVITVDGTTVSLGPGASSIIVNGLTQNLVTAQPASITAPPILTIGGETFTAINSGDTYVINGETLTPGELETVTIDGETYIVSLAPGATVLVIETVGSNGEITATTVETLYDAQGSQATVTNTVGVSATAGSKPTSGPSQSVEASLQNGAAYLSFQLSGVCISFGSLILAIWL